jgi:RimJ/RimL family protein N-acetyltransferase
MAPWTKMRDTVKIFAVRVSHILRHDGLATLLARALRYLFDGIFQCGTFYIYQMTVKDRNEAGFLPKIHDFTFQIVSTNEQAAGLAANGFDFRSYSIYAARRLDKGAIAYYIRIGHELAHVGWVARSEQAKNSFDPHPYRVEFADGEACTGGVQTFSKYEGLGLMTYGCYRRLEFLRELGINTSLSLVNINNIASRRVLAKFDAEIRARARYLKILWWQSWKETPLRRGWSAGKYRPESEVEIDLK